MIQINVKGRFPMGQLVITANAEEALTHEEVAQGLCRHLQCDWGSVSAEDRRLNDEAFKSEQRLLSVYPSDNAPDKKFWIITEADRSVTTVLLPEDY